MFCRAPAAHDEFAASKEWNGGVPMDNDFGNGGLAILTAVMGIWGLVAVVFYIWYLWALSKLFPYLGLPAHQGWIPVWNQWQLIQRAGLPGWTVLLGFVPGLFVVVAVFSILAIHRLNKEFGKPGSFTVLGAFLPPIWAMLLASHIANGVYAGANVYAGSSAFPPLPPNGTPLQNVQPPGQPQFPTPVAPGQQMVPPVPPAPQPYGAPAMRNPYAVPAAPAATQNGTQPNWGATPAAPTPPRVNEPPAAPQPNSAWQGLPPVPPGSVPPPDAWTPQSGILPGIEAQVPETPGADASAVDAPQDPHAMSDWGFSRTTEGAFERLAAEPVQPRQADPLGYLDAPQPFAWPHRDPAGATPTWPAAVPPAAVSPAAPAVPPVPPVAAVPPVGPSIFDRVDAEPLAPPVPSAPAGAVVPAAPPAPSSIAVDAAVPQPAASVPSAEDSEDNTVFVPRRMRWGLELPDGEVLELASDDIVVGRKPQALESSETLLIADPTRTMSKSHARMRRDGETWSVEDLQSTNGLALIDEAGEPHRIDTGIAIPATELMVFGTLEVRLRLMN